MSETQTAADGKITIFEDEELLHEVNPDYLSSLSTFSASDWLLTFFTMGVWLPVPLLKMKNTRYIITDQRFIQMKGTLTGNNTVEKQYDDIVGEVRTSQGLLEGILNKGTIEFEIEKERGQSSTAREFDEREGSKKQMSIDREQMKLEGVRDYQQVSNTIRRIQNS